MGMLFGLLGFSLIICGILMGGSLASFLDLPSIAVVMGPTVFLTFAYHSAGESIGALKAAFGRRPLDVNAVEAHVRTLSTARNLASGSGVLGALIGLVNMLAKMDDPSAIGPAMAVALLTVFYGVLLAEFVLGPLINRLRNGASETSSGTASLKVSAVTLAAIPCALLCFSVVLISFKVG